jgi:hypothetical protein
LNRLAAAIEERAEQHPGFRPYAALAQCYVQLLADEAPSALQTASEALTEMAPFTHATYAFLVAAKAEALIELRQYEHAENTLEQLGREAIAAGVVLREVHPSRPLLALAQVGSGKRELGMGALDRLLRNHAEEHGANTVRYGRLCETRCEAACLVKDYTGFAKHLELIEPIYAGHPSLRARHARWVRFGRERFHKLIVLLSKTSQAADWATRIHTELRVGTPAHHAEHLLSMLLEELKADYGQLFRIMRDDQLVLLAAKPSPADPQLLAAGERCLAAWLESEDVQTADGDTGLETSDSHGRAFIPLWLTRPDHPEALCGLVLVSCSTQQLGLLSPVMVRAIAQHLETIGE